MENRVKSIEERLAILEENVRTLSNIQANHLVTEHNLAPKVAGTLRQLADVIDPEGKEN